MSHSSPSLAHTDSKNYQRNRKLDSERTESPDVSEERQAKRLKTEDHTPSTRSKSAARLAEVFDLEHSSVHVLMDVDNNNVPTTPVDKEGSQHTTMTPVAVQDVALGLDEEEMDQCSICLQDFVDRTLVPTCSHEFCFDCVTTWAEKSRRCPLCTQPIGAHLIHNIRSRHDYSKHFLPPLRVQSPEPSLPAATSMIREIRAPRRRRRNVQWGRRDPDEREVADRFDRSVIKRKWVYEYGLYAKHVASNTFTRYRPYPTPAQFAASQEFMSRTTSFLRRELLVWNNLDVEFLTSFILSLMKSIDIRSESAVKLLAEFLDMDEMPYKEGERFPNAEHFAHEVYSYIRSPYKDLFVYDSVVQYETPRADETSAASAGPSTSHSRYRQHQRNPEEELLARELQHERERERRWYPRSSSPSPPPTDLERRFPSQSSRRRHEDTGPNGGEESFRRRRSSQVQRTQGRSPSPSRRGRQESKRGPSARFRSPDYSSETSWSPSGRRYTPPSDRNRIHSDIREDASSSRYPPGHDDGHSLHDRAKDKGKGKRREHSNESESDHAERPRRQYATAASPTTTSLKKPRNGSSSSLDVDNADQRHDQNRRDVQRREDKARASSATPPLKDIQRSVDGGSSSDNRPYYDQRGLTQSATDCVHESNDDHEQFHYGSGARRDGIGTLPNDDSSTDIPQPNSRSGRIGQRAMRAPRILNLRDSVQAHLGRNVAATRTAPITVVTAAATQIPLPAQPVEPTPELLKPSLLERLTEQPTTPRAIETPSQHSRNDGVRHAASEINSVSPGSSLSSSISALLPPVARVSGSSLMPDGSQGLSADDNPESDPILSSGDAGTREGRRGAPPHDAAESRDLDDPNTTSSERGSLAQMHDIDSNSQHVKPFINHTRLGNGISESDILSSGISSEPGNYSTAAAQDIDTNSFDLDVRMKLLGKLQRERKEMRNSIVDSADNETNLIEAKLRTQAKLRSRLNAMKREAEMNAP